MKERECPNIPEQTNEVLSNPTTEDNSELQVDIPQMERDENIFRESELNVQRNKIRVVSEKILRPERREVPRGKNKLVSTFEKIIPKAFRLEVIGAENLAKVSDQENVVLTTTHITDSDMVVALAGIGKVLGQNPRFGQTKLVQMADNYNQSFFQRVMKKTGPENWLSVNVRGAADVRVDKYDPKDFKEMTDALDYGFPLAIAESLDPYSDGWTMSKKVGNGAARLALGGNTIIPVAVELSEPLPMQAEFKDQVLLLWRLIKRPKARVIIGEPIRIDSSDSINAIDKVLDKRAKRQEVTTEEKEDFKKANRELHEVSIKIKRAIASLLPESRRGPWR